MIARDGIEPPTPAFFRAVVSHCQLADTPAFWFEKIASAAGYFGTLMGRDFRVRKARTTSTPHVDSRSFLAFSPHYCLSLGRINLPSETNVEGW